MYIGPQPGSYIQMGPLSLWEWVLIPGERHKHIARLSRSLYDLVTCEYVGARISSGSLHLRVLDHDYVADSYIVMQDGWRYRIRRLQHKCVLSLLNLRYQLYQRGLIGFVDDDGRFVRWRDIRPLPKWTSGFWPCRYKETVT